MNRRNWDCSRGLDLWRLASILLILVASAVISRPGTNRAYGQNDFLITAPRNDSIERYDATTGDYLGSFIAPGSGGLDGPGAVSVGPDSNLYVTSALSNQILRYDGMTGDFLDVFAEGNGLSTPNNIVFNGNFMYVGEFAGGAGGFVKRYDAMTGDFIDNFLDVDFADGITFSNDSVFVSNFGGGVNRFDINDGSLIEEFIASGDGGLLNPTALLLLDSGEMLVSSYGTNSVKRYDSNGDFIDDAITGLLDPEGLAIGPDGDLYAGSVTLGRVNRYDAETFAFQNEFVNVGQNTNFFTFRATAVPEPTTTIPLAIGVAMAVLRRKRSRRNAA